MSDSTFVISAFVLNALWESTLLVLLVWAALRFVPRSNATTRCLVWLAVLVASLLLPAATSALLVRTAPVPGPMAATASISHASAAAAAGSDVPQKSPEKTQLPRLHLMIPPWILEVIGVGWLGTVVMLLFRLGSSLLYLERLKGNALPFPLEVRSRLMRWNAATKGSREVRLCVSEAIGVPVAIGLFDALILVPKTFLEMDEPDLESILLHELAHLRRGDDWINALQRVVEALLFFSPALAYASARIDLEREVACDDAVLKMIEDPFAYANCLARLTEAAAWPSERIAAPGIFSTRHGVSVRIERLLDAARDARVRISALPIAIVAVAISCIAFLGAYAAPSFKPLVTIGVRGMDTADTTDGLSQLGYSGTWRIQEPPKNGSVNFGLEYPSTMSNSSGFVPLTRLGLTTDSLLGSEHPVEFKFETEAGAFVCSGKVAKGVGDGRYTFVPDAEFAKSYEALFSAPLKRTQQVQAGLFDLKIEYIRAIVAGGFGDVSFRDLIGFKIFSVTPEFVQRFHSDFPAAGATDVTKAAMASRRMGVDLHALHADFPSEDLDTVLALGMAGVTAAYVAALRAAGVRGLSADGIAILRTHGIDQAFADQLASKGPHGLSVDEVVKLKGGTP